MTRDDDPFRYWAKQMSRGYGYGGVFNRASADKPIVEASTSNEWVRSAEVVSDLRFGGVLPNPNDPPDCWLEVEGERWSVELVELVEAGHKKRAMKGESPFSGDLFLDAQWDFDRFENRIRTMVEKKDQKYAKAGQTIDLLIIHTAEPWLESRQVGDWLAAMPPLNARMIKRVSLLMDYETGRSVKAWPMFMLLGNL